MAKSTKHKKSIKKEKNKIKLKLGKGKNLPKGLNVTNTTFQTRKIVLPDQSETVAKYDPRTLNVKKSLKSLEFNSVYVRQDGINELKKIAEEHIEMFNSSLEDLFSSLSKLFVDVDANLRKDSIKLIKKVLSQKSAHEIAPFFELLAAMLSCAMNNINQGVKQDSVLILDVYLDTVPSLVRNHAPKILRDFVDQISRKSSQANSGRVIIVNPVSKLTTLKWRTAVLKRMERLICLMNDKTFEAVSRSLPSITFPEEAGSALSSDTLLNCDTSLNLTVKVGDISDAVEEKFESFATCMVPILFETWVEAAPEEKMTDEFDGSQLHSDAMEVLRSIISVLQALVACQEGPSLAANLDYTRLLGRLLANFPYTSHVVSKRGNTVTGSCLQDNLDLLCLWIQSRLSARNIGEQQDQLLGYIQELLEQGDLTSSECLKLVQIISGLLCDRNCPDVLLDKFLPSFVQFSRRIKAKDQVFSAALQAMVKISVVHYRRVCGIRLYQDWLTQDVLALSLDSFDSLKCIDVLARYGFLDNAVLKTIASTVAGKLQLAKPATTEVARSRLMIQIVGNAASYFARVGELLTAEKMCSFLESSNVERGLCYGLRTHVLNEMQAHDEGEVTLWPYLA